MSKNLQNNVVEFPKMRADFPPHTMEEMMEKIQNDRERYLSDFSLDAFIRITEMLEKLGFEISSNDELAADAMMIIEAIQSMALKAVGQGHPLQEISDQFFEFQNKKAFMDDLFAMEEAY